jgi:hypothetical protein
VEDAFEGASLLPGVREGTLEESTIGEIAFDKFNALRKKIATAVTEIVKDDWLVTAFDEEAGDSASDIARAARNENLHKKPLPGLSSYDLV